MEASIILGSGITEAPKESTQGKCYIIITLSYLFVGVIEQHPTDSEAAPNDVQGTTDTCIIPTLYLDMEHDSTLLERNTISVTSLSSMTQTIQSYYNYSRCCL